MAEYDSGSLGIIDVAVISCCLATSAAIGIYYRFSAPIRTFIRTTHV